jgi:transglutaminase-like putative cysteine protease
MSIHVALNHVTHYKYDRPIHLGPQVVRLRPAPHSRTRILSYLDAGRADDALRQLAAGPAVELPGAAGLSRRSPPSSGSRSTSSPRWPVLNPFDFFSSRAPRSFRSATRPELLVELEPYLLKGAATPKFVDYLSGIDVSERPTSGFLMDLNQRLQKDIAYLIRMEPGVQTPEQTLVNRQRLLPRQRLADGAAAAPPRPWRRASSPAT